MKELFQSIIDRLEAINSRFSDDNTDQVSTDEEVSEQAFAEAVLADGTIVQYEGELAPGTALFVVAEEGDLIPAPEGTHSLGGDLEGVSVIVDADGIITEVIDERGEATAEEEMSEEKSIEDVVAEQMSEIKEPIEAIANALTSLKNENDALRAELKNLSEQFDAFKNEPSAELEETQRFARAEKNSRRERFMRNMKNNK